MGMPKVFRGLPGPDQVEQVRQVGADRRGAAHGVIKMSVDAATDLVLGATVLGSTRRRSST